MNQLTDYQQKLVSQLRAQFDGEDLETARRLLEPEINATAPALQDDRAAAIFYLAEREAAQEQEREATQYLRLDMYIDNREYLIDEGDVTEDGFESILNSTDIIDSRIAAELRSEGVSSIPVEFRSADVLDLIRERTDIDVMTDDMEINFCMCLWERNDTQDDTHLESAYSAKNL